MFGFWDVWIWCVLHLCFQSVETAPKLDSEKTAFVPVFTVFLRGVRVVGGGVTICSYIYICIMHSMALEVCGQKLGVSGVSPLKGSN